MISHSPAHHMLPAWLVCMHVNQDSKSQDTVQYPTQLGSEACSNRLFRISLQHGEIGDLPTRSARILWMASKLPPWKSWADQGITPVRRWGDCTWELEGRTKRPRGGRSRTSPPFDARRDDPWSAWTCILCDWRISRWPVTVSGLVRIMSLDEMVDAGRGRQVAAFVLRYSKYLKIAYRCQWRLIFWRRRRRRALLWFLWSVSNSLVIAHLQTECRFGLWYILIAQYWQCYLCSRIDAQRLVQGKDQHRKPHGVQGFRDSKLKVILSIRISALQVLDQVTLLVTSCQCRSNLPFDMFKTLGALAVLCPRWNSF